MLQITYIYIQDQLRWVKAIPLVCVQVVAVHVKLPVKLWGICKMYAKVYKLMHKYVNDRESYSKKEEKK